MNQINFKMDKPTSTLTHRNSINLILYIGTECMVKTKIKINTVGCMWFILNNCYDIVMSARTKQHVHKTKWPIVCIETVMTQIDILVRESDLMMSTVSN